MSTLDDVIQERNTLFTELSEMTKVEKEDMSEEDISKIISAMRYNKKRKVFYLYFDKIKEDLFERIAPVIFKDNCKDVKLINTKSREVVYDIFEEYDIDKSNVYYVRCHKNNLYSIKIPNISSEVVRDLCGCVSE
jgi:RNA binding exosome subunit